MSDPQLFWLHIKKSAGSTTRSLLQPYYLEVDRVNKPKTFIQASRAEYNDILNNFRVVLGEYQFRRCLFAKQHLYGDQWDRLFSFAFAREPVDRCISMFYYVYFKDGGRLKRLLRSVKECFRKRRFTCNTSYAFDTFLNHVQEARSSECVFRPLGNLFTTHTAPMWEDITDDNGKVLLKAVFRLENLVGGINRAFEACGIQKRIGQNEVVLNRNKKRRNYAPTKEQVRKIESIYGRDFEIYENAR